MVFNTAISVNDHAILVVLRPFLLFNIHWDRDLFYTFVIDSSLTLLEIDNKTRERDTEYVIF